MSFLSDTDIEQALSPSSKGATLLSENWQGLSDKLYIFPFLGELLTPIKHLAK